MSHAEATKSKRLAFLEAWARSRYEPEQWKHDEFRKAIEEYCLISYGLSDGQAKNLAKIVQLRMIKKKPVPIVRPVEAPLTPMMPLEQEESLSLAEIISGYRKEHPEEFKAPPTNFTVTDEEGKPIEEETA